MQRLGYRRSPILCAVSRLKRSACSCCRSSRRPLDERWVVFIEFVINHLSFCRVSSSSFLYLSSTGLSGRQHLKFMRCCLIFAVVVIAGKLAGELLSTLHASCSKSYAHSALLDTLRSKVLGTEVERSAACGYFQLTSRQVAAKLHALLSHTSQRRGGYK